MDGEGTSRGGRNGDGKDLPFLGTGFFAAKPIKGHVYLGKLQRFAGVVMPHAGGAGLLGDFLWFAGKC